MGIIEKYSPSQVYLRLLGYVWPHKWVFMVSIMGFAMFASSAPMLAHLMGVLEETLEAPTDDRVIFLIVALFSVFLFRGLGTFIGKYFTAVVAREVIHNMRVDLFAIMLRLPAERYDGESSGRMISRVIFDVEQVNGAATKALTTVVQEGLTVVGLMVYLIWLDARLTLIFLVLVPVIGAFFSVASRFFRKYSRRIQATIGDVTQVTNETIHAYREIRTFGTNEYEMSRFLDASERNKKQTLKFAFANAVSVPVTQQIVGLGLMVMVYLMFLQVQQGSMSPAEFLQFFTAASLIAKPLRALTDVNSTIQQGVAAATSVFSILDSNVEKNSGVKQLERASGEIYFRDVTFSYPNCTTPAVNDISLQVEAGECVAFVGRSGSGKSTLVNLLPRFYDYQSGKIELDGTELNDLSLDNLRNQIAIVSQKVTLFSGTIKQNIEYGSLGSCSEQEIIEAARAAHVLDFTDSLPDGLDTYVGESGVMLSGGQRQRIAIARALLKNAPILILDEATSALDTESERAIQAALDVVMKNRTTLIIAHRLSTIEHADKIVVIDNGSIVEQGSHSELISANGIYSQLHAIQFSE